MQSDELARLLKVHSVIAGACIPIFHHIFTNEAVLICTHNLCNEQK